MSHAIHDLVDQQAQTSNGSWTPESLVDEGDARTLVTRSEDLGDTGRSATGWLAHDAIDEVHADKLRSRGTGNGNGNARRKSVEVMVEESGRDERYILRADEPELRDIIRSSMEQEIARLGGLGRSRLRDLVFTRQFTTFDRQNPRGAQSPFHGFFTLFWLAMAILLLKIAAQNYRQLGSVFGRAEILHLMLDKDLFLLLATDGAMCLSTTFSLLLQMAISKDYLTWDRSGWVVQSLWQMFFTASIIWITFHREFSWTHTVFIVMHVIVLLMKQHSYSFYNGYLSRVHRRRRLLDQKLLQLDTTSTPNSGSSADRATAATGLDDGESQNPTKEGDASDATRRRRSFGPKYSTNLHEEESETASIARTIETHGSLDPEQIQGFRRVLTSEIAILDDELRGKSTSTSNTYPSNLTLYNLAEWTCLPTLVYELDYPRHTHINWWYVAEKTAATLGVIWIMIIISEAYLYPVVVETVRHKASGMSLDERWEEFPWVVLDMLFPLLLEQLLAWYVIWECLLNVLAELTLFADRGFYGDWWNSVSFDQYARDWNRPVHRFLLRHVYHSSISALRLSKTQAMLATFLLSAVAHEVLMFCLFRKLRGYLFAMQLSQVPLAALSKTRFMRRRETLGNVIFWFGLFIGPSLITGLYLIV